MIKIKYHNRNKWTNKHHWTSAGLYTLNWGRYGGKLAGITLFCVLSIVRAIGVRIVKSTFIGVVRTWRDPFWHFPYCWLATHLLPRQSLNLSHTAHFVLVLVWARLWRRLNSAGSQKGLLSCAHYVTTPSYYVLSLPLQDNSCNVTS